MIKGRTVAGPYYANKGLQRPKYVKCIAPNHTHHYLFAHGYKQKSHVIRHSHYKTESCYYALAGVKCKYGDMRISPWYLASQLATIHMEVITSFVYSTELWSQISCRKLHWSPYLHATKCSNFTNVSNYVSYVPIESNNKLSALYKIKSFAATDIPQSKHLILCLYLWHHSATIQQLTCNTYILFLETW